MTKCPKCAEPILYLGFGSVECSGLGCDNYKPFGALEPEPEYPPISTCDDDYMSYSWYP